MENKYTIEFMADRILSKGGEITCDRRYWQIEHAGSTWGGGSLREALEEAYYGMFQS